MPNLQNFPNLPYNYLPAILKEYPSRWQIEYWVENPKTNELQRKVVKINRLIKRYKSVKEARNHANNIIVGINQRLASGFNPLYQGEDACLYVKLVDVCDLFIQYKQKELREQTMRSYKSMIKQLMNWVSINQKDVFCSMFSKRLATMYLDYIYSKSSTGPTTYNNHVKTLKAFFSWALERSYCKENPFDSIKKKKKSQKSRILIPKEWRERIFEELSATNKPFLLVCMLVFNGFCRPNEARQIQLKHINLSSRCIILPPDITKNGKSRRVPLTDEMIDIIVYLTRGLVDMNLYLFGPNQTVAAAPVAVARFTKIWTKLRDKLQLPKEMQLYSFRDSGITESFRNNIDGLTVQKILDHHSLEITKIYTDHHDEELINRYLEKAPKFSG